MAFLPCALAAAMLLAQVPAAPPIEAVPARGAEAVESPAAPSAEQPSPAAPPGMESFERERLRPPADDESFASQMLRSLLALAGVVLLIYLVFKLGLQRLMPGGMVRSGRSVRLLERVQLDMRHSLYVVELDGGKRLLLGSSERGMSVLADLSAKADERITFHDALQRTKQEQASSPDEDSHV